MSGLFHESTLRDRLVAKAYLTVRAAVKRGLLPEVETQICKDCGNPAECWDHRNYHYPLAVDPVCKACNNRRGPGFPYPVEEDGRINKRITELRHDELAGGKEGFEIQSHAFHADLNWSDLDEVQEIDSDLRFNEGAIKRRNHYRSGASWSPDRRRYEFFKARDPWSLS